MTIPTKLTRQDYINANLAVMINRSYFRNIILFIGLVFIVNIVTNIGSGGSIIAVILPALIILSLFAVIIYFSVGRGYAANKRFQETINYTFDPDNLKISGDSFKSEISWDSVPKVTLTKSWLLLWQNKQIANVIPKRDVSAEAIATLKSILTVHGVKNNL